jgi:beta-lactamase regulating signal transducer with metallopeptidase domain
MTFISIVLRASVLLALAWGVHAIFGRRMSAAMRHFVWMLAVVAVLLLPIFSLVVPAWPVVEVSSARTQPSAVFLESTSVTPPVVFDAAATAEGFSRKTVPASWAAVLMTFYASVVVLLLARLLVERLSLQRLVDRSRAISDDDWTTCLQNCARQLRIRRQIQVLRSDSETMPMTFGFRRPAIVIPASASTWPDGRRRVVMLHETAHIARLDCLTQMLAAVACAIYWIHPMVWWVARRLRVERELACDDCVLASGAEPREYAENLLELAYTLGGRRAPELAVTMAGSPQIEGRMLAVLDPSRHRGMPTWSVRVVAVLFAIIFTLPVAAATVTAGRPRQSLYGVAPRVEFAQRTPLAAPQQTGTWEIRASRDARTVHLRMTETDGSFGTTIDVEQLNGLSTALLAGGAGPATFTLRRDAGAFNFEGVFRDGVGGGTYTFAPSPEFPEAFVKRGYARPTAAEQYLFARANVSLAFLDELTSQNYARPDMAQLIRAVQHGVSLIFLREMGQLGYRLKAIDALVTLRDHGVSPQYVRDLTTQGLKGLSADELVRARSHGVSPEYVGELRAVGHQSLTLDTLIRLRDHGVSPQYLQELAALGYDKLPLETTITLRNHGVSPEYVRDLRALGYSNLPIESLVHLRTHGVSPEYVRELNALGYSRLTIDELVGLRNHGISADRIRRANARAGTRLTIDALRRAAADGWR